MEVSIKKAGWAGGGVRYIKVVPGSGDSALIKVSGKTMHVSIGPGLPSTTSKITIFFIISLLITRQQLTSCILINEKSILICTFVTVETIYCRY